MTDAIDAFRAAIAAAGLTPPETIEPDGALHRYPTNGARGDDSGWYTLHVDGIPAGAYGDWRSGVCETWCSRSSSDMSATERSAHRERMDAIRRARDAERERRHTKARERTAEIWTRATAEIGEHQYLRDRGVQAYGIRTDGERLLVPVRDIDRNLHSLQHIDPRGNKRYRTGGRVAGCYHAIGRPNGVLCVCEGYATGASVHEATGHAVAVAFSAGNIEPVARALHAKYPGLCMVICADDDAATDGNPGLTAATAAARAVGGLLAIPDFGADRPEGATDMNDLHRARGAEAVRQAIENASPPDARVLPRDAIITCAADVTPRPITWLWPGRIAIGKLSIIAGDPGLGKSMVTIAMAVHVTRGTPWPVDHAACPAGDVLMLSAEDDLADTIRPRLDAAGADVRCVHVLSAMRDTDRGTGEAIERSVSLRRDVPRLAAVLDSLPTCRMVVIDPISAYLDGTDSHANADVRGLLAPLAELASRYRVALVAVTHLRKGEGRAIYRAIGSIAFAAAARFVAVVTKDPQDETRRLVLPAKNNLGPDASGLAYSITTTPEGVPYLTWAAEAVTMTADDALSPAPADDERTERDEAAAWLREVLADGPMPARDVRREADEAGHSWRTVRRAQSAIGVQVSRDGFGRGGRWRWSLDHTDQPHDHRCPLAPIDVHPSRVGAYADSGHLCGDRERAADHRCPPTPIDNHPHQVDTYGDRGHLWTTPAYEVIPVGGDRRIEVEI